MRNVAFGKDCWLRQNSNGMVNMLGFLMLVVVLAGGFCAGYATREMISRRRRTEYLKYQPYITPSRRPKQPPAFLVHQAPQAGAQR